MKKVMIGCCILLLLYFISNDLIFVAQSYKKPSIESVLPDDKKGDSLSYNISTAEINAITRVNRPRGQSNKIVVNSKFYNINQACWTENLVELPHLLFIGTMKKEGDSINVIYNQNISCKSRENAIYILNHTDYKEIKYFKTLKAIILLIVVFLITWDTFLKKTIKRKK